VLEYLAYPAHRSVIEEREGKRHSARLVTSIALAARSRESNFHSCDPLIRVPYSSLLLAYRYSSESAISLRRGFPLVSSPIRAAALFDRKASARAAPREEATLPLSRKMEPLDKILTSFPDFPTTKRKLSLLCAVELCSRRRAAINLTPEAATAANGLKILAIRGEFKSLLFCIPIV